MTFPYSQPIPEQPSPTPWLVNPGAPAQQSMPAQYPPPTGPLPAAPGPKAGEAPRKPSAKLFQPVELKDAMRFFQVPARKWWWALIGLVAGVAAYFLVLMVMGVAMVASGTVSTSDLDTTTPALFLWNNAMIAVTIPVAILLSYVFYHQGFGWLTSVVGRFRWKWFLIPLAIFAAGYAVQTVVEIIVYTPQGYGLHDLDIFPTTTVMVIGILLTTPLQCAAEEFESRGVVARLLAALIPHRLIGLIVSALGSSTLFMLMHAADDFWLQINYFTVGIMMWWLVYRTGGLEASIAFHIVNNLFSEWYLPFTDISDMFDRSEGTGSPILLVYLAIQAILVLLVDLVARRKKIVRMSAPAADRPSVMKGGPFIPKVSKWTVEATVKDLPRISSTPREEIMNPWGFPAGAPYTQQQYPAPQPVPYAMGQVPSAQPYGAQPQAWDRQVGTVPRGTYPQQPGYGVYQPVQHMPTGVPDTIPASYPSQPTPVPTQPVPVSPSASAPSPIVAPESQPSTGAPQTPTPPSAPPWVTTKYPSRPPDDEKTED